VEYVDASKITIKYDLTEDDLLVNFSDEYKTYELVKFRRTNQDTTINLSPLVLKGEKVTKGQVLVEGYSTTGILAKGK
jgi:DNA-directed RNA polymerase subunit beta